MSNYIERQTATQLLTQVMSRRKLRFDERSQRRLRLYATEKLIDLSQILVMEGKYNFVGECGVSGLTVIGDLDGDL